MRLAHLSIYSFDPVQRPAIAVADLAADRQSLVVMTDIGLLQTQVARQPPDLLFRIFLVEPEKWHNYSASHAVTV